MSLPAELQQLANSQKAQSQTDILRAVYDTVSRQFTSSRHQTYLRLWDLFRQDLSRIWDKGGFCHCTQQNELIKQTLLATGNFSEKEVRKKWGLAHYISPHQWLQVNINNQWIDVDPWGRHFNVPLGKNAAGFTASWHRSWHE